MTAATSPEIFSATEVPLTGKARGWFFAQQAQARRAEKEQLFATLKTAVDTGEIRFYHGPKTTYAYRVTRPAGGRAGRVVHVSTAICHPGDTYSKRLGSAYAAKNMLENKYVALRMPADFPNASEFIEFLAAMTEDDPRTFS